MSNSQEMIDALKVYYRPGNELGDFLERVSASLSSDGPHDQVIAEGLHMMEVIDRTSTATKLIKQALAELVEQPFG